MPVFMVERRYAEQLESSAEAPTASTGSTTRKACAGCTPSCRRTSARPTASTRRRRPRRSGGRRTAPGYRPMSSSRCPDASWPTGRSDGRIWRCQNGAAHASWCSVAYRAAWVRLAPPVFIRMLRMWLAAVFALMKSRARDLPVAQARGQQPEHLDLPGGQVVGSGRTGAARSSRRSTRTLADRLGQRPGLRGQLPHPGRVGTGRLQRQRVRARASRRCAPPSPSGGPSPAPRRSAARRPRRRRAARRPAPR